ncbi:MAG: tRNA pseudouridine(13) synthase TruD [Caldilineaceae bacterium]
MLESNLELTIPYLTGALPGIGGQLRATAEHFIVEELPLYEPVGEGQHLYVNLTKSGLTTKDVQRALERRFGLPQGAVGFAGLKDKYARTTQTFSIPVDPRAAVDGASVAQQIAEQLPVTVNWTRLHKNKLKAGHLLGNRFRILVTDLALPMPEAIERAQAIAQALKQRGIPNFFGAQRFGHHGANVAKGLGILQGSYRERNSWLRKFLVSSYQSYLCNRYLARRIEMGAFDRLLAGDVAKKYATGGMFDVVDVEAEQPRYTAHEISFTAPLLGAKLWAAKDEAGALEAAIAAESPVTQEMWQKARVDGTRRMGRLLASDLQISQHELGIVFDFSLPKGAFATTVLREFMKVSLSDAQGIDSDTDDG